MAAISLCWSTWCISYTCTPLCWWYMNDIHNTSEMTNFLRCFWMKCFPSLLDYGTSLVKCLKGFRLRNYATAKMNVESQVPAISMYRRRYVFILNCFLLASSCQCQLAYILYEYMVMYSAYIYMTLKPRLSEVCNTYDLSQRLWA